MGLFCNRQLALCCCLFVVLTFFGFFLPFALLPLLLGIAVAALALLPLWVWRKGFENRALLWLLLALTLLLSASRLLIEQGEQALWEKKLHTSVTAELRVKEVKSNHTYGSVLLVEVESLAGEECSGAAVLRCESATPFVKNDLLKGEFLLAPLESDLYYPQEKYTLMADGARLTLYPKPESTLQLLESGNGSFSMRLNDGKARLSYRLRELVGGKEGELLSAMLLGDRAGLSSCVQRDFRRAGCSHLLAISGLHLTILIAALERFLRIFRIPRRVRIGLVLPCGAFYVLLCGAAPSILRAFVMLCFLSVGFLLGERSDAMTSLFLIAALMALISPTVVFDLSYLMTVLATLGLLAFGGINAALSARLPKGKGIWRLFSALLRYVIGSLLVTFSASIAVLPVMWLVFGELSLATPFANLLLVPLATLFLIGGAVLLLLPVPLLGKPVACVGRAMLLFAEEIAKGHVMLSLRHHFMPYILLPLLVLTTLLLVIKLKKRAYLVYLPGVLAALAIAICLCATRAAEEGVLQVAYRTTGENEGFVLVQDGKAVLCDSSNGSLTQLRADYALANELCATEVQALLLTHYHNRHVPSLSAFSKEVVLRELWLPEPQNEQDEQIREALVQLAQRQGIAIKAVTAELPIALSDTGELTLSALLYEKRSTQPSFFVRITNGAQSACYHAASFEEFADHAAYPHVCLPEYLLLGGHGPVPREAPSDTGDAHTVLVISDPDLLTLFAIPPEKLRVIAPGTYFFTLE